MGARLPHILTLSSILPLFLIILTITATSLNRYQSVCIMFRRSGYKDDNIVVIYCYSTDIILYIIVTMLTLFNITKDNTQFVLVNIRVYKRYRKFTIFRWRKYNIFAADFNSSNSMRFNIKTNVHSAYNFNPIYFENTPSSPNFPIAYNAYRTLIGRDAIGGAGLVLLRVRLVLLSVRFLHLITAAE